MSTQSGFNVTNLIGNLAALAAVILGMAVATDYVAHLIGWETCIAATLLTPVSTLTVTAGVTLGTVGAVIFLLSGFQRPELLVGAIILGVLPGMLLHYLGGPVCEF